ncbi:hypothetical protein Glove_180g71 [Diversispora epigaea]|uniref:Uncharacterized protein n=1 Tax=Diversispora epigaea TaxID=1348612 RepID=A0A397IXK7_9GLOM|nr:hypothetical protein Glove_180g71 [Diversispora epigaea]
MLLPIIDLDLYLNLRDDSTHPLLIKECQKAVNALKEYGALIVKDSRVTEEDNYQFLNLMEDYYAQPTEIKLKDARPEIGHNVGVTPEYTETPRCQRDPKCKSIITNMPEEIRPKISTGPDSKWRYFWHIGSKPKETKFPKFNPGPVIPEAFKDVWEEVMNKWGNQMHQAIKDISEMIAIGFGLPKNTLTDLTQDGPHLLAPTGSDLNIYGKLNTILAGFHYDLDFLTIHGKSKYPGLNIWPRDRSSKIPVRVPDGCLLVQAGKQLEWMTAGEILAGYHEVIVTEDTLKAIEKVKRNKPDRPLWRVSSTLFFHIASDNKLNTLKPFKPNPEVYPAIYAGEQVRNEYKVIELMK